MQLKLTITGKRGERLGTNRSRTFGEAGGTIGRSGRNDWVLPDDKRYLSGLHATISFRLGRFYVTDHSMNGVFVNGGTIPIGDTAPHRIFEGDSLRLGNYRMQVEMVESSAEEALEETVAATSPGGRVEEPLSAELAIEMLDEDEIADQMDMAALLEDNLDVGAEADELVDSMLHSAIDHTALGSHTAKILELPPGHSRRSSGGRRVEDGVYRSLLKGLQLDADLFADGDPAAIAFAAGLALREFVQGGSQMNQRRAQINQTFQLGQPPVQSADTLSVPELLADLLTGAGQVYSDPAENVRVMCERNDHHQAALLFAMREAFRDFADQLRPAAIRAGSESGKSRLTGNRKAQYYEQYREVFHELMARPLGDLPAAFRERFAAAYGEQMEQLRQTDRPTGNRQAAAPE